MKDFAFICRDISDIHKLKDLDLSDTCHYCLMRSVDGVFDPALYGTKETILRLIEQQK